MTLLKGMVKAVYNDAVVSRYKGNPLIEALPPFMTRRQLRDGLSGQIEVRPTDIYLDDHTRIHIISQLLDAFFQPLSRHIELESKLAVMLRQGYVGRNLATGDLTAHIQNGYERVMQGDLSVFRYDHVESTAKSLAFIGCSGSGKTSAINRILATYPQLIFHERYNLTQIVFLKIDCPHDGTLKSLCHNFFREIDAVLSTNYVRRYVEKRHSVETLISIMAHIANTHAIGLLVIDEIQHLNTRSSGGAERMLNFFVTLVNEISVPIVMVGTPKARPVFELDLRSARRAAGFGAFLWEPIAKPSQDEEVSRSEWGAFTNLLWKYQWLKKASAEMSDEIRETWYDLSQGIMDVVVKLFALSQIRAVVTGIECITPTLMRKVYQDELKPIHPMLDALRSGDVRKIAQYSDLTIPDVDKKILDLVSLLRSKRKDDDVGAKYRGNDQAIRLHNMLVDIGYDSEILEPFINRAFDDHPDLALMDLMNLIVNWYQTREVQKKNAPNLTVIKQHEWEALEPHDLRYMFSQAENNENLNKILHKRGCFFEVDSWVKSFG